MNFAGFLCFLSVLALSLALPADPTAKDVQTQSPLVMENKDTRSVVPENMDKEYLSKKTTRPCGVLALSLSLPSDSTAKDVQTQSPLVMENKDTRSVVPEDYLSKLAFRPCGVHKTIHRLKRQALWNFPEDEKDRNWCGTQIHEYKIDFTSVEELLSAGAGLMPNLYPLATVILCMAVTVSDILL